MGRLDWVAPAVSPEMDVGGYWLYEETEAGEIVPAPAPPVCQDK